MRQQFRFAILAANISSDGRHETANFRHCNGLHGACDPGRSFQPGARRALGEPAQVYNRERRKVRGRLLRHRQLGVGQEQGEGCRRRASAGGNAHSHRPEAARGGLYKGRAVEPKRNISGSATVTQINNDVMLVKGCAIGGFLICKEQRWTKLVNRAHRFTVVFVISARSTPAMSRRLR